MKFWKNRNVFITGHTGFKGSWLTFWLLQLESRVTGYSLKPELKKNLFDELNLEKKIKKNYYEDIRDYKKLYKALKLSKADVVFHLAAQPLVLESYNKPIETFQTNVLGTANLLQACRDTKIKSVIIVTTDKCYENKEWIYGYREVDRLGGYDPYSSSKACVELLTSSFNNSFFKNTKTNLATVRAGNVIGGGDWSKNRIVPDIIQSLNNYNKLKIRNKNSTRPWQHVLEPLSGYLKLARLLYTNKKYSGPWNFGPNEKDNLTVKEITKLFLKNLPKKSLKVEYLKKKQNNHEASLLLLDISKVKKYLGWNPKWNCETAIKAVIEWNKYYLLGKSYEIMKKQIFDYNANL